jgi:protein-tyrosine phosphatase
MSWLRAVLRGLRHGPDRLLHPRRRARAERVLRAAGPPRAVYFICLGNICRSPYAASRFRALLGAGGRRDIEIHSAGFIGPDRPSPPELVALAAERGIDLGAHRSRTVSRNLTGPGSRIIVMEPAQQRQVMRALGVTADAILILGDLDPEPIERRGIQDPFGHPPEVYARVLDRIDRCVATLGRVWGGPVAVIREDGRASGAALPI